jgi:hypothetical protein
MQGLGATELKSFDYEDDTNWKDVLDGVNVVFSSSPDNLIEGHMKFAAHMGETSSVKHCIRISCFGADTMTGSYNPDKHVTRENAKIPVMLQV